MVKSLPADEFLVSFLVDARGGYMQAQRMPQMKIFVPPDAAPAPTRIICHLLRPDSVTNLPGMNDCDGFASRILQIHSSCLRFQKPILIEMPHIALLRNGDRELVIMKKNFDSETWKEHSTTFNDETLKTEFGSLFESITPLDQLESSRICRIITTDVPNYFSLISRFQRDIDMIGPDGGFIESKADKRIKLTFPQGALMKKIQISLEVQNVDPRIVNHIAGDDHKISLSPIITVEPKRRKFRDLIKIQMGLPKEETKNDLQNLRLLFSISEYITKWEDVTNSTELDLVENCIVHSTKISARVWLIYAPDVENVSELANKIYALHCPTPYVGKFLAFARRHEQEECQIRCILITDDTADKTLECQESFELIATGPEIEIINKLQYQIECAGNIVAVTKSDESILFPVQSFFENRITLPIRLRNTDESFNGKIAFIPHFQSVSKQIIKPVTTLDIIVPECIVDMVGSFRNPDRKHRVKNASIERIKGCQAIAKTELDLKSVADGVGGDWCNLAEELGLEASDINLVLNENCTDEEKAFMTLIEWQSTFGRKATGNELNRALRKIGREDVVKTCMGDISFVEDEEEVKSAIEQLNDEDKKHHDECWDDVISTKNKPPGYNESVDESMIVETGDDWSQSHRESKLSDISDDKSLVMESTQDSENELHTEIKPVVDPTKAVTSVERTASEKTAAYLLLANQLDETLPQPVIQEPSFNQNYQKEVEEQFIEVQPFMSAMPSHLDYDLNSDFNEQISPVRAGNMVYAQPLFSDSSREKIKKPENEYDTEVHSLSQKDSVLYKVIESSPEKQTKLHVKMTPDDIKVDTNIDTVENDEILNPSEQQLFLHEAVRSEPQIQTELKDKDEVVNQSQKDTVLHEAMESSPQIQIEIDENMIIDIGNIEIDTNTDIVKNDEIFNQPEKQSILHEVVQTEVEEKKIISDDIAILTNTDTVDNDEIVNQPQEQSALHEVIESYPQLQAEIVDNNVVDTVNTIDNDEVLNQPEKHSVLHEVIESEPQIQTEVEEEMEILPDGSIVNRKVTRRQISRIITEKTTRDILPEDQEYSHSTLCSENPTEVIETEEELPDGSIVKRTITTSKTTTSTTSKIITEKEVAKDENVEDSPVISMGPKESSTENGVDSSTTVSSLISDSAMYGPEESESDSRSTMTLEENLSNLDLVLDEYETADESLEKDL